MIGNAPPAGGTPQIASYQTQYQCTEMMGERRIIAQFSTCGCVEMRQIRGGIAVKCAGAAHQVSTERTEAEETAIYTEKCGVRSPSIRLSAKF